MSNRIRLTFMVLLLFPTVAAAKGATKPSGVAPSTRPATRHVARPLMPGLPPVDGPLVHDDPKGLFTVSVPEGWTLERPSAAWSDVHIRHRKSGAVAAVIYNVADVAVGRGGPDPAVSGEDYYRRVVKDALPKSDMIIVKDGPEKIGGLDGFAVTFTPKDKSDRRVQVFAVAGGKVFIFFSMCPSETLAAAEADLQKIRESLKIHDPPRPPERDHRGR
jgi:hypothetical protein